MTLSAATFDGWFYLVFGIIIVVMQYIIIKSTKGQQIYVGYNNFQILWLIFGLLLIINSIYVLIKN